MTMAFGDLRSVSGYWLGPPVWFESPRPEPLAIPGLPEQSPTIYRRLLDRGGEAVVSTAGVVLFDFAGLEPDDPTAKELATSPFPDSPRTAAASVVAPRRVELLNAHQFCLLDAIGVLESDEDVWSPDPRPVGVRTLWTGLSVEQITIPNNELTTYLAFLRDTPPTLRRAFTFRGDTLDRSFTTYEQVLAVPVAPRACHCLLHAADHYHHWRFDQALMLAWAAAEALLAELWAHYAEDAAQAAGHTLNSDRRRKLTGARVHLLGRQREPCPRRHHRPEALRRDRPGPSSPEPLGTWPRPRDRTASGIGLLRGTDTRGPADRLPAQRRHRARGSEFVMPGAVVTPHGGGRSSFDLVSGLQNGGDSSADCGERATRWGHRLRRRRSGNVDRLIKPPMQHRDQAQQVECVLLAHRPANTRRMCGRVSEGASHSFEQVHQAPLFATLAFGAEAVERDPGCPAALGDTERLVDQLSAISIEPSSIPQPREQPFGRLQHRVEVVITSAGKWCDHEAAA
jgi:hypothetical protein